jgi:hypothetical protein
MLRRSGLARPLSLAVLTVILVARPGLARADTVYTDIDRDGHRDVLSFSIASRSTLQVWLSSTQTLKQLRISRPILKVGAFDLDGDGHPEIVASDTSAKVHIWRQTKDGRLRRVKPHHSSPLLPGVSTKGVSRPVTEAADIPLGGADTIDDRGDVVLAPPSATDLRECEVVAAVLDCRYSRSGSRAPPGRS